MASWEGSRETWGPGRRAPQKQKGGRREQWYPSHNQQKGNRLQYRDNRFEAQPAQQQWDDAWQWEGSNENHFHYNRRSNAPWAQPKGHAQRNGARRNDGKGQ